MPHLSKGESTLDGHRAPSLSPIAQPHCSATGGAMEGPAALLRTQPRPPPQQLGSLSRRHTQFAGLVVRHVRALDPQAYHIRHVLGAAAAMRFTRHAGLDFRLAR